MVLDIAIAFIADVLVVPVVLIGAWAMLRPRSGFYQRNSRAFMTGLSAMLFAKIASMLYQGERPFVTLGTEPKAAYLNNPGFPSDHTLLVFTITLVAWASTKNRKLTSVLLALSGLVALGRILALVHTPADVAGGILCALLAALLWYGPGIFSRHLRSAR